MNRYKPRATWLDRQIARVSPTTATQRIHQRAVFEAMTGGGYHGGRRDRRSMRSWRPGQQSADSDILPDLSDLRGRSRDAVRNNPIALGALNRTTTNVVGSGLKAQPQIDRDFLGLSSEEADEWEASAARIFNTWAKSEDCDASRTQDFAGLQDMVFRAVFESGDCFVVPLFVERPSSAISLALQVYEADQVSNPSDVRDGTRIGSDGKSDTNGNRVSGGIEQDGRGAPVRYWLQAQHPGNITGRVNRSWTGLDAFTPSGRRQVRHIYRRQRIGQSRGVPELAPVIESLKQLSNYSEAELFAAVIGAMITVVYSGDSGDGLPENSPDGTGGDTDAGQAYDKDYKMEAGQVLEIEGDDNVSVPTVGRPNSGFSDFFVAIVRQIGAALELPFEVLIQHFTSSYSASRGALEMAWQMFRTRRHWLAQQLCQWAYERVIEEAVARGRLRAPGFFRDPVVRQAWLGAVWIGPAHISLDPAREVKAYATAEDRAWRTAQQSTAELTGGDWQRNVVQRGREEEARRANGVRVGGNNDQPQQPDAPPGDRQEQEGET